MSQKLRMQGTLQATQRPATGVFDTSQRQRTRSSSPRWSTLKKSSNLCLPNERLFPPDALIGAHVWRHQYENCDSQLLTEVVNLVTKGTSSGDQAPERGYTVAASMSGPLLVDTSEKRSDWRRSCALAKTDGCSPLLYFAELAQMGPNDDPGVTSRDCVTVRVLRPLSVQGKPRDLRRCALSDCILDLN